MRLVLAWALLLALLPAGVAGAEEDTGPKVRLLVEDGNGLPEGITSRRQQSDRLGWSRIEVEARGTAEQTARALADETGQRVVVERFLPLHGPADEPLFPSQWWLENTGQSGGKVDADVDASTAWGKSTGAGVVVAIIDSGIAPTHPELDSRIWQNPGEVANGADDDANDFVDDLAGWDFVDWDSDPSPLNTTSDESHATMVAGVVAAEVNGVGITGIAPDARLMNLRACQGGLCSTYDAALAVFYAIDMGADIINLSFGGPVPIDEAEYDPLWVALSYAEDADVLVVTSAGNTPTVPSGQIMSPAELGFSNNLSVAATDRQDNLAGFSYSSPNIDIAAPGVSMRTTVPPNGYSTVSGTSFSSPLAAGAAALLLSAEPGPGPEGLMARLKPFADHPAGVNGKVESGRLNAGRALTKKFVDTVGHLFEDDIDWLADEGITKGCNPPGNTLFCPNDPVTRGAMAAFLVRALGLPPATHDHFVDDNGTTFEADINRLAESGITKGCNPPANDRYCPAGKVTREQMAAFLVRALDLSDPGPGDLFDDDDGSIFENDIDKLGTAGITKGCNPPANNLFCPGDPVNRGAMAAFLHRALG